MTTELTLNFAHPADTVASPVLVLTFTALLAMGQQASEVSTPLTTLVTACQVIMTMLLACARSATQLVSHVQADKLSTA